MFKLIVNGVLHRAPLPPNLCRALDFGTGTGNWAIDFADEHPDCEVLGTDLSLIQPSGVPPNCDFVIEDVRSPWIFDKKFDYIHGRSIKGIVDDWDLLYREIHNNLENGGWVEIQEIDSAFKADDDTLDRAPRTSLWNEKYNEAGRMYVLSCPIWRSGPIMAHSLTDRRSEPIVPNIEWTLFVTSRLALRELVSMTSTRRYTRFVCLPV